MSTKIILIMKQRLKGVFDAHCLANTDPTQGSLSFSKLIILQGKIFFAIL